MSPSRMTMVTSRPRIALNCSSFIQSPRSRERYRAAACQGGRRKRIDPREGVKVIPLVARFRRRDPAP
jgi:hypothetical protein